MVVQIVNRKYFLLITLWVTIEAREEESIFCKFNEKHLLCNAVGISEVNDSTVRCKYPETEAQRNVILDILNGEREKIAKGDAKFGGKHFPRASNLMKLKWCDECERAAFHSLKTCEFVKPSNCCDCSNIGEMSLNYHLERGFNSNYKDSSMVHKEIMTMLQTDDLVFPLTCVDQISWDCFAHRNLMLLANHRVTHVGCAYTVCEESPNHSSFVCFFNLRPSEAIGKPLYEKGTPCAKCPQNSHCTRDSKVLCECDVGKECHRKEPKLGEMCKTSRFVRQTQNNTTGETSVENIAGEKNGTIDSTTPMEEIEDYHSKDNDTQLDYVNYPITLSNTSSKSDSNLTITTEDLYYDMTTKKDLFDDTTDYSDSTSVQQSTKSTMDLNGPEGSSTTMSDENSDQTTTTNPTTTTTTVSTATTTAKAGRRTQGGRGGNSAPSTKNEEKSQSSAAGFPAVLKSEKAYIFVHLLVFPLILFI